MTIKLLLLRALTHTAKNREHRGLGGTSPGRQTYLHLVSQPAGFKPRVEENVGPNEALIILCMCKIWVELTTTNPLNPTPKDFGGRSDLDPGIQLHKYEP